VRKRCDERKEGVNLLYLESRGLLYDIFLRSRKHAVFCDLGGGGVRHDKQVDLVLGEGEEQ
jgi:hypothetical protein